MNKKYISLDGIVVSLMSYMKKGFDNYSANQTQKETFDYGGPGKLSPQADNRMSSIFCNPFEPTWTSSPPRLCWAGIFHVPIGAKLPFISGLILWGMGWSGRATRNRLLSPDVVIDRKQNPSSPQIKEKELLDLLQFEADEEEKEYRGSKIVVYIKI